MFEFSEITKKDMKKCVGISTYMMLDSNEPFNTFVAQLLVRIETTFSPSKLSIEDYILLFSIPRISPLPIVLTTPDDYNLLLECVKKNKDHLAVCMFSKRQRIRSVHIKFITRAGTDTFFRSGRTKKMMTK